MHTQAPEQRVVPSGAESLKFSSRPAGSSNSGGRPLSGGREITAIGILTAFRRRWIPALTLGIPAALLVMALIWEMIPAAYESYALLKIQQFEQVLNFETKERQSEFLTYRDTQKALLKSRGVLTAALRNPEVSECRTLKKVEFPVDWLAREIYIGEEVSPEFLRVSLEGEYPADLALIVNAVKDSYLNEVVYSERNERIERLKQLELSFEEVDKRVRTAQHNIDQLAEKLGSGDPKVAATTQAIIQNQILDLQKDLREINAQIRGEEAARQIMKENGIAPGTLNLDGILGLANPGASSTTGSSPFGMTLQQQLMAVRTRISQFEAQTRNTNHPDLLDLKQQEQQLVKMISGVSGEKSPAGIPLSRIDVLMREREKIQQEIDEQTDRLQDIGQKIVQMEQEQREIEQDIKLRDDLSLQLKQRRVEMHAPERISVAQAAHVPEKREIKKKTQMSFLGGLAVLGSIICGFTLFEWFSHRVGATTDISGEVGLRLVGTIPSPDRGGLLGLGVFAGKVDYDEWNRAVTESMDVVRTFLMRHIDPSRPASILITSASANEGKTTVSCQLAASLARTGKRVALVDCDLRRPSAHEMIGGQVSPGISEYLRGEFTLDQIAQKTAAPGLAFFSAGMVDQSVLQKLSADGGRSIISELKGQFDFVVIDTSPLLFVAEPSIVAQNSDIVLLATRKDYSRVPYVMQARDSLRSLQVPLLGAIMVGADSDFQRQTYGYQQDVMRLS
ncbi:MAG: AAA family ATPase [Planctomycetaceae bacterium]|nr:AAA family ATPase [Planctomycetaceae bacterium]